MKGVVQSPPAGLQAGAAIIVPRAPLDVLLQGGQPPRLRGVIPLEVEHDAGAAARLRHLAGCCIDNS